MKRICIADIHLSAYKDDTIDKTYGLPLRLSYLIEALNVVCKYAMEKDIKYIDIAGDLHNDKDVIYTDSQNAFINHVILKFPKLIFTLVTGNHDLSSTGEFCSSCIEAYKAYPNVRCVINSMFLEGPVLFVPYCKNIKNEIHNVPDQAKILISHFGLSEGVLQSGMSVVSNVGASDLCKYRLTILGHYHKPQHLDCKKYDIYYVGNPVHLSWNDKNEDKRFLIYDTETYDVVSVPLKGFFKEYREFTILKADEIKGVIEAAKSERDCGHNVKIRKKIKDEVKDNDIIVIDDSEIDFKDRGISMSMSEEERQRKYMDIRGIPKDQQDYYVNIAKEIISCRI